MTLYITALKQYLLKMFDLELVRDSDNKISLSLPTIMSNKNVLKYSIYVKQEVQLKSVSSI